jgi:hypothetical protein
MLTRRGIDVADKTNNARCGHCKAYSSHLAGVCLTCGMNDKGRQTRDTQKTSFNDEQTVQNVGWVFKPALDASDIGMEACLEAMLISLIGLNSNDAENVMYALGMEYDAKGDNRDEQGWSCENFVNPAKTLWITLTWNYHWEPSDE